MIILQPQMMSISSPRFEIYFSLFISGTLSILALNSRRIASSGTPFILLESIITLSDCHLAFFKFFRIVLVWLAVGDLNSHLTPFIYASAECSLSRLLFLINSTSYPYNAKVFAIASSCAQIFTSPGFIIFPIFLFRMTRHYYSKFNNSTPYITNVTI